MISNENTVLDDNTWTINGNANKGPNLQTSKPPIASFWSKRYMWLEWWLAKNLISGLNPVRINMDPSDYAATLALWQQTKKCHAVHYTMIPFSHWQKSLQAGAAEQKYQPDGVGGVKEPLSGSIRTIRGVCVKTLRSLYILVTFQLNQRSEAPAMRSLDPLNCQFCFLVSTRQDRRLVTWSGIFSML